MNRNFTSYIDKSHNGSDINEIITMSDLHGDLSAFIINLRDNSRVIRKRGDYNKEIFDPELQEHLDVDLNLVDKADFAPYNHELKYTKDGVERIYRDDINYEWIGGTTHIVIVGDIIDNSRGNDDINSWDSIHEEVKLLRFINAIDDLAKAAGGRVIKLYGNHDYISIIDNFTIWPYGIYCSAKAREQNLHGIPRLEYFKSEEGNNIMCYNGIGIIIKIKDYVFVHGTFLTLSPIFPSLTAINEYADRLVTRSCEIYKKEILERTRVQAEPSYIDKQSSTIKYITLDDFNIQNSLIFGNEGMLMNREFGELKTKITSKDCDTLYRRLHTLCASDDQHCKDNIKLVIGHCPQFNHSHKDDGFINERVDDIGSDMKPIVNTLPNKIMIDGTINFSCTKNNEDPEPRLYRVDVGLSRAFDSPMMKHYAQSILYNELTKRSPQVLRIIYNNNTSRVRVRRSTIKNTLIHQPRSWIDENIKNNLIDEEQKSKIPKLIIKLPKLPELPELVEPTQNPSKIVKTGEINLPPLEENNTFPDFL